MRLSNKMRIADATAVILVMLISAGAAYNMDRVLEKGYQVLTLEEK